MLKQSTRRLGAEEYQDAEDGTCDDLEEETKPPGCVARDTQYPILGPVSNQQPYSDTNAHC